MKKFITLLFAIIGFFSATSFAQQGTLCNPDFTFTVNNSTNLVQFVSLNANTSGFIEHEWNFGDGSPISSFANPGHVYAPGSYNVIHIVSYRSPNDSTTIFCIDSLDRFITIATAQPCDLRADFSFFRDSIQTNKVYFNNLSSGLTPNTIVRWNFGDGTISNDINPTHIFQNSGAFTVCLSIKRDSTCAADTCRIVQVQVPAGNCNLQAYYTSQVDSSNHLSVQFFNQTVNFAATDSVRWTFGDGSSSLDLNPSHTYNQNGTYNVCLIVKRPVTGNVPCVREYCQTITVFTQTPPPACTLHAGFSFVRDSIQTNKVYFTNLSTGTTPNTVVKWTFGDGMVSYDLNPTHIFQASGAYTVCLSLRRDSLCAADTCMVVQVQVPANTCNLVVNFGAAIDSIQSNVYHFTNLSTPQSTTDTLTWTFGDGTVSHDFNPSHTYTNGGVFNVCLVVKKSGNNTSLPCVREFCRSIIVDTPQVACNLQAYFSMTLDSSNHNIVYFVNQSVPQASTDSIRWTFGDGSSSTDLNPVHTYSQPGTYTICLRVKKQQVPGAVPCVGEYCKTITIQTTCNLVADFDFASDSISGGSPNVYRFTNTSTPLTPADSSFWSFGDGSPLVINPNAPVVHTYAVPGVYVVCLLVKKVVPGSITILCERQVCKTIVVSTPPNPCDQLQVNFQWNRDSANSRKIIFHNLSSPVTANTFSTWTFGDGSPNSNSYNADHIYAQPGTYTACLSIRMNNTCMRDTCQVIVIPPSTIDSCNIHPTFNTRIDSANRRKVYFNNTTVASSTTTFAVWSFGDGTTGTGWNADHIYTMPGWYAVCLSVTNGNICTRTWCDSIFVPGNVIPPVNCDTFQLRYVYRVDNYMPNKLFFFATSNAPVYDQQWTFTNLNSNSGATINHRDPVYVFPDTGLYNVCVRASFAVGCVKEFCDVVRIASVATPNQCVVNAYPNPAHEQVSFNLQLDAPGPIVSTIVSLQGVVVSQITQTGVAGNNLVNLNIQNLGPGFYNVRIMYGGRVCYTRFQKI